MGAKVGVVSQQSVFDSHDIVRSFDEGFQAVPVRDFYDSLESERVLNMKRFLVVCRFDRVWMIDLEKHRTYECFKDHHIVVKLTGFVGLDDIREFADALSKEYRWFHAERYHG